MQQNHAEATYQHPQKYVLTEERELQRCSVQSNRARRHATLSGKADASCKIALQLQRKSNGSFSVQSSSARRRGNRINRGSRMQQNHDAASDHQPHRSVFTKELARLSFSVHPSDANRRGNIIKRG